MYEDLILPKDPVLREAIISCLDFPHDFKINIMGDVDTSKKRQLEFVDKNEKKQKKDTLSDVIQEMNTDVQDMVLMELFTKLSYSEVFKFTVTSNSKRIYTLFAKYCNDLIENNTLFVKKKFIKQIKFADLIKNPFSCFDTRQFDSAVKPYVKSPQESYKCFMILLSMLSHGKIDLYYIQNYNYDNILFTSAQKQLFCKIDLYLKSDAPDGNRFMADLHSLQRQYLANEISVYRPMMISIVDISYPLTHRIYMDAKKQLALHIQFEKMTTGSEDCTVVYKQLFTILVVHYNSAFSARALQIFHEGLTTRLIFKKILQEKCSEISENEESYVDFAYAFMTQRRFTETNLIFSLCNSLHDYKAYTVQLSNIEALKVYVTKSFYDYNKKEFFCKYLSFVILWDNNEELQKNAIKELFRIELTDRIKTQKVINIFVELTTAEKNKYGPMFGFDNEFIQSLNDRLDTVIQL